MTCLIGVALLAPNLVEPAGWTDLGSTSIAGKSTPIRLFRDAAPTATVYVCAGRSYAIFPERLNDIVVDGLSDARLKELYAASRPMQDAVQWRIKVVVLPMFGFLEVANGAARVRRSAMNEPQVGMLREQLAATEALIEMRTEGRVDVILDFEVDPSSYRLKLDSNGLDVSGSDREPVDECKGFPSRRWVRNFVEPRFNRGSFDADDGKYRGPYDSRWVIHAGPTLRQEEYSDGTGAIQVFSICRPEVWWRPDGLTRDLLQKWEFDVAWRSRIVGRNAGVVDPWTPPKVWPRLTRERLFDRIVDPARYLEHSPQGVPLPVLLDEPKAGPLGVQSTPGAILVELGALPAMAELIPSTAMPTAAAEESGRALSIVPRETLDFPKWSSSRSIPTVEGPSLTQCGMVERVGGDETKVFRFTGGARAGMIRLARLDRPGMLTVELSMTRPEPFALWQLRREAIGYSFAPIANVGSVAPKPLELDGERIAYQLEASTPRKIALQVEAGEVFLGPSPEGASMEPHRGPPLEVTVIAATVSQGGETTAPDAPVVSASLLPPEADLLLWAGSEDDSKRLPALVALSLRKVEGAESVIAEQMKSANPYIAMAATEALQFHSPQIARPALTGIIFSGPFDPNRESAANVLDSDGAKLAGPGLSVLLTAPNAITRTSAVRAMGRSTAPESQILMAGFFQDPDPVVRFATANSANPAVDLLQKRLQFASVNDPSEQVRLAALKRLVSIEGPASLDALKGVRDESPWVRIDFLLFLGGRANPKHLLALRNGIADSNPLVRATALREWTHFVDAPKVEDLTPALSDPDPRVQKELIGVCVKYSIKLADDVKSRLKASIDPRVRTAAEDLP